VFLVTTVLYEFREGDLVRHHSCAVPIRVIGIGATIAVEYPNGVIRAFEPFELEKVPIANGVSAARSGA
jgi:hypothetical protein